MGEFSVVHREKSHMVFIFFFPLIYSFCRKKRGTEHLYLSAACRVSYDFQPGFPWGFNYEIWIWEQVSPIFLDASVLWSYCLCGCASDFQV